MVRLKELRDARNVRPEKVADVAGVSVRTLTNYEQGTTIPPVDVARKIADFFGVPEAELEWGKPSGDTPKDGSVAA